MFLLIVWMITFYELRFARFACTGARESLVENIASIRAKTGKNALCFVRIFRTEKALFGVGKAGISG